MSDTVDIITYAGMITVQGYESICEALKTKKSDKAILVLATSGGDPHAGFRIARALHCTYGSFDALIPRYCKSAGTLIAIGASTLYMDDMSELGPLDIQIKKGDELVGRNSGLDIFQAVTYLQVQSMSAFRNYLMELTRDTGLSTRVASDIASNLTSGLFEPLVSQIDPIKLAETQRATEIAFHYGFRLNEKSNNLREEGLNKLVTGYPSHGFVIDRKEARSIFINVNKPEGMLRGYSEALHAALNQSIESVTPDVRLFTFSTPKQEQTDGNIENPEDGTGSHHGEDPEVDGHSKSNDQQPEIPADEGSATGTA